MGHVFKSGGHFSLPRKILGIDRFYQFGVIRGFLGKEGEIAKSFFLAEVLGLDHGGVFGDETTEEGESVKSFFEIVNGGIGVKILAQIANEISLSEKVVDGQ